MRPGDFIRHDDEQSHGPREFPRASCPHFDSISHRHPALALVFTHEAFRPWDRVVAIER